MNNSDFRQLALSDVEQAADVISQAFINDPLCAYMLPYKQTRLTTLRKFFRAYGEVNISNQRGYGVCEPLKGVAFWMEPNHTDVSIRVKSLSIFLPLLFTYYPIGYIRARAILKQIDHLHQKYTDGPHYHLDNIGVLPSNQGEGLSSRLIRPFLSKADAEKAIVYTDTVTRANVGLYEHFEFQTMDECPIVGKGITIWALRRTVQ